MPRAQMRILKSGGREYLVDGVVVTKAEHDAEVARVNKLSRAAYLEECCEEYRKDRDRAIQDAMKKRRHDAKRSDIQAPNVIDRDGRWATENYGRGHLVASLSDAAAGKEVYVSSKGELEQLAAAEGATISTDWGANYTGHSKKSRHDSSADDAILDEE